MGYVVLVFSLFCDIVIASEFKIPDKFLESIHQIKVKPIALQLVEDLKVMYEISGTKASAKNKLFFGGEAIDGKNYFKFFFDRIHQLDTRYCGSKNAPACYYGDNTLSIANGYGNVTSQAERLAILIHEARHVDNKPHATCPIPYKDENGQDIRALDSNFLLQGRLACDVDPEGSYAVSIVFLRNLAAYCDNCSRVLKAEANKYGNSFLMRIIPVDSRKELAEEL